MPPGNESPLQSLTAARVVVVAGKGGVGKTTVTAVLARAAAADGRRVLVVELDGKPTIDEMLPQRSGHDVTVMHLSAPEALEEYLNDHGFKRIAKRLNRTGVIDMVGTAAPGIDDVVVLGKIKSLDLTGEYDLIVVDGPAAGHAVTFLTSAAALGQAARGGPVKAQADDVLELLGDPDRCAAVLVTLPETTPVNETIETAFALEDQVGIGLGPVVVNAVDVGAALPDVDERAEVLRDRPAAEAIALEDAAAYRESRRAMEREAIDRLAAGLPLRQIHLSTVAARAGLTADDIDALAAVLIDDGAGT